MVYANSDAQDALKDSEEVTPPSPNGYSRADIHMHTNLGDGWASPAKIVEVATRQGHLLGLFVTKAPKAMRSVEESIENIKEQGGLVIVPHPLGRLVPSLSRAKIDTLLEKGYAIDGIEMYNPSPANASMRSVVRAANQQWRLAETGGSDAHF